MSTFYWSYHLKAYLKAYPKVNLRLQYDQAQKIYDDVASSEIDLGIVAYPRAQRNVSVINFAEDHMVVALSPSHDLARNYVISPKDLDGVPLILFTHATPTQSNYLLGIGKSEEGVKLLPPV